LSLVPNFFIMMNTLALDLELSIPAAATDKQPCISLIKTVSMFFPCCIYPHIRKLMESFSQYQNLADKYAPIDSEITSTLAKLQLPPELRVQTPDRSTFVPLPSKRQEGSKQQTAEAIRDGRRASKKIASLLGWRTASEMDYRSGTQSFSGTTDSILRTSQRGTSATTVLEQDFTVPGKKSQLLCPFQKQSNTTKSQDSAGSHGLDTTSGTQENTPHHSSDPICAALYAETLSSAPQSVSGSAAKCPIRYLDQHSPEEVARYFEIHKHEIPRSHEVCVKRYQRNEEDIRKLDAKYGNLVSMISGLGQKHQPMLPVKEEEEQEDYEVSKRTTERVKNWAKAVSSDGVELSDTAAPLGGKDDIDRESRFDRPMKEVRLGESPSRPWGIAVPYDKAPVIEEPNMQRLTTTKQESMAAALLQPADGAAKCPFGHGTKVTEEQAPPATSAAKCPVAHSAKATEEPKQPNMKAAEEPLAQPTFIQSPNVSKAAASGPQMIFTGPVFIGYPIDQAMSLMQQWQIGGAVNGGPV
jgi:hypothetical protein